MATESHSPETLAKAADKVEEAYGTIERKIQKKLYSEIEALMTKWQGDAARAFYKSFQAYDKEFSDVQNSLNELHKKLVQTGVDYNKNEVEQSQTAANLQKLIGR
ncbi:WXG100 family type VII secretion target [Mariniluteicoccus flavus]